MNKVQFVKKEGNTVCSCCNTIVDKVPCPAKKIWEFMDGNHSTKVIVYHEGTHTCSPSEKRRDISEATLDGLKEKTVNRTRVDSIIKLLDKEGPWEDIDNLSNEVQDKKRLANNQHSFKQSKPNGHSFDAVVTLKSYTDKKDPLYIYTINNVHMNNGMPTYVFKTSKLAVELALQMDKDGEGFMSQEYCFLDAKHDRYKIQESSCAHTSGHSF